MMKGLINILILVLVLIFLTSVKAQENQEKTNEVLKPEFKKNVYVFSTRELEKTESFPELIETRNSSENNLAETVDNENSSETKIEEVFNRKREKYKKRLRLILTELRDYMQKTGNED